MHYNFIEIGTSDYDTLLEKCSNNHYGICVDPLDFYLEKLPQKEKVKKVCSAIIPEIQYKENIDLYIFYIDEEDIMKYNLDYNMRGCNSIGKPHDYHLSYGNKNLVELGIVKKKKIKTMTLKMLIQENDVTSLNLLKTDIEGMDADVLLDLINFYKKNEIKFLPKTIVFENNIHGKKEKIDKLLSELTNLNYSIKNNLGKFGFDTMAKR